MKQQLVHMPRIRKQGKKEIGPRPGFPGFPLNSIQALRPWDAAAHIYVGPSPSVAPLWEDFRRHAHRYASTSLILTLSKLTVKIDSHRASGQSPMAEERAGSRDSGIAQP